MAAINPVIPQAGVPIIQQVRAAEGTMEKVKQFMCRIAGIGTVFSILAGVAVAALWGIKFGLLTLL